MASFLIGLVVGCLLGWELAHHTVASECRRLGAFYVGDSVFRCIEEKKSG
jgi:hypothetical protein